MAPPHRGVPRGFHPKQTPYDNGFLNKIPSKLRPRMPNRWENRCLSNYSQRYVQNIPPLIPPNNYAQFDSYWKNPSKCNENFPSDEHHDFQSFSDDNIIFNNPLCNIQFDNIHPHNESNSKISDESNAAFDKSLCDTIDTVKRKLQEKKMSESSQVDDDNISLPEASSPSAHKITSCKKRIEHSKMSPKILNVKRDDKKDETRPKSKSVFHLQQDKSDDSKKSQNLRRNILKQLFKMNNTDLRQILSNPESSVKYNFALASLIKDTRNTLSKELRNVAEKSLKFHNISADTAQGEIIVRDAFLGHLGKMLDTSASLELFNMEPQLISELSKVLQEDLMGPVNDDISARNLADVMHENITDEECDTSKNDDNCHLQYNNINCKEEITDPESFDCDNEFILSWKTALNNLVMMKNINSFDSNYEISTNKINQSIKQENTAEELDTIDEMNIRPDTSHNCDVKMSDEHNDEESIVNILENPTIDDCNKNCKNIFKHMNDEITKKFSSNKNNSYRRDFVPLKKKKRRRKNIDGNSKHPSNIDFNIFNKSSIEENSTSTCDDSAPVKTYRDVETQYDDNSDNLLHTSSQTDAVQMADNFCQTDNISIDDNEKIMNENKIYTHRGVIDQMKMIDNNIQNLLLQKTKLYDLLDMYTYNNRPFSECAARSSREGQKIFSNLENKIITHIALKKKKCVEIPYAPEIPLHVKQSINAEKSYKPKVKVAKKKSNQAEDKANELKQKFKLRKCSVFISRADANMSKVKKSKLFITSEDDSSSDDSDCVVVSENCEIDLKNVFKEKSTLLEHKGSIVAIECVVDNFLAVSMDGFIYYYNGLTKDLLCSTKCSTFTTCICLGKKNSSVYTGSLDSYLRCYDFKSGTLIFDDVNIDTPIQSMCKAWNILYIGTRSGCISQFDISTNTLITDVPMKITDDVILALYALKEGPRKVLLVATRSQNITINDANTGLLLRTFNGSTTTVYSLLFDAGNVFCGTASCNVEIFDFATGELVGTHSAGQGVTCLKMYKGLLFTGCYDSHVYIFKPTVIGPLAIIPGAGNMILSMAILNDKVLVGYNDKSLIMWSIPEEIKRKMTI